VENQTILTDVKSYNLSEQIRSSVLLLENAWVKKNIDLQLDFDEFYIEANEELMKQVFINLIDNAIKFTDYGGTVAIRISDKDDRCIVYVSNTGNEISPENQKRIFNKFYQADESHSTEGNGIGLAIVKRIVDLHRGEVSVESKNGMTTFGITLFKTVN
jgi:signal transduction histidine kinase